MSVPEGTWDLTLRTPVGHQEVVVVLARDAGGALVGTAAGSAESVPLEHVVCEGDRLRWSQSITRPMRLRLDVDVVLDGDHLHGHSRAGRLPRSSVTGERRCPTSAAGPL